MGSLFLTIKLLIIQLLANLFNINEIIKGKIIIKCDVVEGKYNSTKKINFTSPFPNKCFNVILSDYGSSGTAISIHKIIGDIKNDGFDVYSHKVYGEANYPFLIYLALGY